MFSQSRARRGSSSSTKTTSTSKSPDVLRLPPASLEPGLRWFSFILALQVVVMVLLIIVAFVDIVLQHYNDKLTTRGQILYTALTTFVATGITAATVAEMRKLWTYITVHKGQNERWSPKTATIIGLLGFKDMLRAAPVPIILALAGLITSGIVTGLQPTSMTVVRDMPVPLSVDRNLSSSPNDFMVDECHQQTDDELRPQMPNKWFSWEQPRGNNLTVQWSPIQSSGIKCPTYAIRTTLDTLDHDGAITLPCSLKVHAFAAGTPFDLVNDGGLPGIRFDEYKISQSSYATWSPTSFQWASACVPLIVDPVAVCRPADGFEIFRNRLEIVHGDCNVTRIRTGRSISTSDSEFVSGACTSGRPVGKATILMGATNEYGEQLCGISPGVYNYENCTVACEVDVTASLSFRRVLIRRPELIDVTERHILEVLGGRTSNGKVERAYEKWGEECTPTDADGKPMNISTFLTGTALATAAAASWQLLAENVYEDGYPTTLFAAAEKLEYADVLQHPISILEDLLSIASRLALGFHYGQGSTVVGVPGLGGWTHRSAQSIELWGGKSGFSSVRVGTKSPWAVLFILPSLFAELVLLTLWWRANNVNNGNVVAAENERKEDTDSRSAVQ